MKTNIPKSQAKENAIKFLSTVYSERAETEKQKQYIEWSVLSSMLDASISPPHGGNTVLRKKYYSENIFHTSFCLNKGNLQTK